MGQSHSTAQPGTGNLNERGAAKQDYYELLEVEENASPEEIKKAYRKKALELHPDRNLGNVEASTNLFAEIQSAYEVLSDPQERSWYDSHRDAFLGDNGGGEATDYSYNARMMTAADILKLFSKFSLQMEFTDSPNGFYGGLRQTFAQLALEEDMAGRWENMETVEYPSFGSRDDDFRAVRDFYAAWGGFSTKKSFSWKDVHRYSEAPDRRVRRLMEKENKRLREAAIREFNEAVRSLVAFAKKRDPRYKSYKESLLQHREALQQSAASQATRSRAANQARLRSHVQQDWAKPEEPGEDLAESSEEGETEQFECIVCRKTFKSQNQFQAHERSKKHIKAVKQLRWEMKIQHDELNLGNASDSRQVQAAGDGYHEGDSVKISLAPSERTSGHLNNDEAKHGNFEISLNPDISTAESVCNPRVDSGPDHNPSHPGVGNDEADYAPREVLERRLDQRDSQTHFSMASLDDLSRDLSTSTLNETLSSTPIKIGKAKQKRAKKAQLAAEKSQLTECTICNASFPSRNKLFSHIKSH